MVIHILQYGRALCTEAGKIFVKQWPQEWKWTSVVDAYESTEADRCPACFALLEEDPKLVAIATPERPHAKS